MDKEEAVDILKNCIADYVIGDFCVGKFCPMEKECKDKECVFEQAIDTALNYIEELEKENENYKKYAVIMSTEGLLINGVKFSFNDYIPKQKVRDKIEELEEYQKQVESKVKEKYSERDTLLQVIGGIYYLKELLESEN